MDTIERTLESYEVRSPGTFGALTVFPLVSGDLRDRSYLTLDEAQTAGTVNVREIDESGSVPEIELQNLGKLPVLLLDGEELVGAKQNRVLNLTVLAPSGKTIRIPVSCVEAGRWGFNSDRFASSEQVMYSDLRRRKSAQVSNAMDLGGTPHPSQRDVWDGIAYKACLHDAQSPSLEMREIYRSQKTSIDRYVHAFPAVEGQIGAIFALGGSIRGVEMFDHTETLKKLLPKIVRSYALDAIEIEGVEHTPPTPEQAAGFLKSVASAGTSAHDAVGLGRDIRLTGPSLAGGALLLDDLVIHLCAFRLEEGGNGNGDSEGGSLMRSSWRRQRR